MPKSIDIIISQIKTKLETLEARYLRSTKIIQQTKPLIHQLKITKEELDTTKEELKTIKQHEEEQQKKIEEQQKQIDFLSKGGDEIEKLKKEKEDLEALIEKQKKHLKQITESYNETLKNLFPASLDLSTVSKPQEIRKYLEKMKAITLSIFQLVPHVRQPSKKSNMYGLVLALRRILSSSFLSQDLSVDLSTDISMSDLELNDEQLHNGLLFWYEAKFKEMHDKMMQSMQFDDIAEILGNLLQVEPTEINEETIVEMFNSVKERLDESEKEKETFINYKNIVDIFIIGVENKVPQNLISIVQQLKSYDFKI